MFAISFSATLVFGLTLLRVRARGRSARIPRFHNVSYHDKLVNQNQSLMRSKTKDGGMLRRVSDDLGPYTSSIVVALLVSLSAIPITLIQSVSFAYVPGHPILHTVSFELLGGLVVVTTLIDSSSAAGLFRNALERQWSVVNFRSSRKPGFSRVRADPPAVISSIGLYNPNDLLNAMSSSCFSRGS